jgi:EAL domain-containing protein (putative c-di-GMP-specific phosphodiesterase class I)
MPGSDEKQAHDLMERFRLLASLTGATVSIGVAQLEADEDTEMLREKADSTLYTAKRRGRNAVCTFSGDNAEQKVVTLSKINALRELLRADHIGILYQPVVNTQLGTIVGYEALARIPDGFDLDGPQEAFDIAERIGHSHDLDLLCIREGIAQAGNLREEQVLFLNLSPRTLEHAAFSASAFANLVLEAGLNTQQVCFEITEHTTAPVEVVQREVNALKECGFKIALDDVGAGNSGLELMRRLTVDYVKIDRSVVNGALDQGRDRGVLLAIIVFASEAGAFIIAEGIETQEMLSVIQQMNEGPFSVQGIQGYILGVPAELPPLLPLELSA